MTFIAIDVETANADMSSICQIGLAQYSHASIQDEWKTYIDPDDYFDPINTSIHGIDEETVRGAPRLPDIADKICTLMDDRIAVCHTHFDRTAISQAFQKHDLRHPKCVWLDSARVSRRTWTDFARGGYGLHNVCQHLGYDFQHHDALEDAKAAGHVLLAAIEKTGLSVEDWLTRVEQPIAPSSAGSGKAVERGGNPDGPLFGEVLVFTGTLEIPRNTAADLAAAIGCQVTQGVTKKTTLLVVGDQDVKRLAGHEKSSKHRKAEILISQGQAIRILRETDFQELARLSAQSGA
jgi:DNA polymerase-3 subunit epsilon